MEASLVQLNNYVFLKTEVNLNKGFARDKKYWFSPEQVDCSVNSAFDKKNDLYYVELRLKIDPDQHVDANLPYCIEIAAVGEVGVNKNYDKNKEEFAVINGATLLYSAMREHLLYLTSRYPSGSLFLPVVDFRSLTKPGKTPPHNLK